jgi:Ca2+-transporting ATPase
MASDAGPLLPQDDGGPGLTADEAAARLAAEGPNELPRPDRRTPLRILFEVIREPMFALLLGAGAIYLVLGDLAESLILLVFATASVSIAVVQETRSERVLEALRDLTSPRALVIRDGERKRIPGRDVVRGDLVVLAEGDRVPADAVLRSEQDLEVDESLLTGESVPVRKAVEAGPRPAARPGGDGLPYVFSGSLVVRGLGLAEVTATGARSEIGKIGQALGAIEREQPRLRVQTRKLVRVFAAVGLSLSALVVLFYGLWRGSWLDAVLAGIALGMSMLPEEFPLVLTVFTVMGAWRISRARVLTRRAAAIETLGAATVLCTDKTGTLTQNRMTIVELRHGADIWRPRESAGLPPAPFRAALEHGILASAPDPFDPMEKAFHALGRERLGAGGPPGEGSRLVHQYGLRSDLLAVTNVWERTGSGIGDVVAAKGAPEAIAALCGLADADRAALRRAVDEMAREGIRVLGIAGTTIARCAGWPESPRGFGHFDFLGLVGLADPLRPGVPDAVRECRSAGIRVVMITGDYPATARAIARQAGIDAEGVVAGDDLERLTDPELAGRVRTATVFARVMPEQKLRIVEALKAGGEIVGMTGDGVNDAPSLKAAHIGIAMGGRGTDVAREAASLVLLDDDFGSIVAAVRLGRRIYDNLGKAMGYIMAVHVPIAGLALLPLVFGLPLIFTPIHIAFLEMVIDPVCSIVFEAEGEEDDVMRRPPRRPEAPLFTRALVAWSLLQGLLVLVLVGGVFVAAVGRALPEDEARSLAFATLVATNAGLVLVNRSFSASMIAAFRRPNRALWWVVGTTAAILAAVILIPPARDIFRFGPLHADELAAAVAAGLATLVLLEGTKRWFRPRFGARASTCDASSAGD